MLVNKIDVQICFSEHLTQHYKKKCRNLSFFISLKSIHFCLFLAGKDDFTFLAGLLEIALLLLSSSSSLSSSALSSFTDGRDSKASLAAFLFAASKFPRNFLSIGSFEGAM